MKSPHLPVLLLALCCAPALVADESPGLKARLEQMLKDGDFGGAVALAEEVAQAPPAERPALLRLLSRAHEGAGDAAQAVEALLQALEGNLPSLDDVDALERLGRACLAAGVPERAVRALEYALAHYPGALTRYGETAAAGYVANRRLLDQAAGCVDLASALAEADLAAGREGLRPEVEDVARRYPRAPGAQALWVRIAREQMAAGDNPGASVTLLRVLSATGDRTRPYKTKLPDNQAYLDAISTAHSRRVLLDALSSLSSACAHPGTGEPIDATRLTRMADLWHLAEVASYSAVRTDAWAGSTAALVPTDGETPPDRPLPRWEAVLAECGGTALAPVAQLVVGQWLQYRGLYAQAAARYDEAQTEADRLPGLAAWLAFERGELALQTGRPEEAVGHYGRCADAADRALAAEAALRLAECTECLGRWAPARDANQTLSGDGTLSPAVRKRAELALERLADAQERVASREGGPVARYLGQDRQTQGDWQWRGRDQHLLCALLGGPDLCGGALGPWQYAARTTDPNRHVYWWHGGEDADATMPYDPTLDKRGPRNWNDGGEKTAPGTGPDLSVDLPVPAGECNLCLYFVNDRNYYEPNRMFTVHLTDAATGAFLAAAPVRDFVSGVHTLFRVTGPGTVRVRVWRNLSMNTLLTGVFLDEVTSLPDWPALTESRDDLAGVGPAWDRFRSAWQSGADGPTQRVLLNTVCEQVRAGLGDINGGRALEAMARKLAEAGFEAQSIAVQDAALAALARGSQRRYAAALVRALDAFGRRSVTYFSSSRRRAGSEAKRALHPAWAAARARDYAAMVAVPSSLVAPEDLVQLAHALRDDQPDLAGQCFLLAVDGDLTKLPSKDLWAYAYCLRDDGARAAVLQEALARGGPLPRSEATIRSELVRAYCAANRLDEAEAQMELVMGSSLTEREKGDLAWILVSHSRARNDPTRARRWAERIARELPGSTAAPKARGILKELGQ